MVSVRKVAQKPHIIAGQGGPGEARPAGPDFSWKGPAGQPRVKYPGRGYSVADPEPVGVRPASEVALVASSG